MSMFSTRMAGAVVIVSTLLLSTSVQPVQAATFSFAVFGHGNPAVKVEVSAEGFRQTHDLAANGRTSFDVPDSPSVVYFWIEGCGGKHGGSYTVNKTVAARLDVDSNCVGTIHSNQGNMK